MSLVAKITKESPHILATYRCSGTETVVTEIFASVVFTGKTAGFSLFFDAFKVTTAEKAADNKAADKTIDFAESFIEHLTNKYFIVIFAKKRSNIQHLHFYI